MIDLAEYDRFRYDNFPFRATNPDWLGTAGSLLGLTTAPANSCRVLELGCGRGGNLVGLAAAFPESNFIGIDHAPSQIADAQADTASLGLRNCEFRSLDIRHIGNDLGEFDYIICHGVFSWVPDDVRDQILTLQRSMLAPGGVGFISFNALPGWSARGMIREMLRRWVPEGPADQMAANARRILAMWQQHSPENGPLSGFLAHEAELLQKLSDHYLYFEHLVEHNKPYLLTDFVDLVNRAGLAYLGDADLASMNPAQLGDDGQADVESLGLDRVATEQLLDDITIRFFRRALVCRAEDLPDATQDHRRLAGAWVSSEMTINEMDLDLDGSGGGSIDMTLTDSDGATLRPEDPHTAAVLWSLAEHRPTGVVIEDLAAEVASRLGRAVDDSLVDETLEIVHALVLRGRLDAGRHPRQIAADIAERPCTTPLARFQALEDRRIITTARHDHFVADRMDLVLLRNLDGEHDHHQLLAEVVAALESGELEVTIDDEFVNDHAVLAELITTKLDQFHLAGLVVTPSPV